MSPAVAEVSISLQSILLATDFSPCSQAALLYATGLSRHYGSTLYTVNVIREELSDVQPPDPFYLRHVAEKGMADLVQFAPFMGIAHRELLREGDVSQVLPDLIQRLGIGLLVLGTRGRGGVKKLLLGSVAEQIVGSVTCPVLTVGPHISANLTPELRLQRILCAIDLLPGSTKVLATALWLAEREHAYLTVVHVIKGGPTVHLKSERSVATDRIEKLLADLQSPSTDYIIDASVPAERITKAAVEANADLIVMGPHHGSLAGIAAHLPWATPHQVLCHACCPVLTVSKGSKNAV